MRYARTRACSSPRRWAIPASRFSTSPPWRGSRTRPACR
jgi:hypothetical protein